MEGRSSVVDAARALAGAVKPKDSPFLTSVLSQNFITPRQAAAVHRILGSYQPELEKVGFRYDDLKIPTEIVRYGKPGAEPVRAQAPPPPPHTPAPKKGAAAARKLAPWKISLDQALAAFPPGFQPRPGQRDAIERINKAFESGKRVVVLESPTGAGKSFNCMTFARAVRTSGGRTHFLTIQKTLQDQYTRDFPAPEVEVLKGRANYPCTHANADPGMDAANGVCKRTKKGILGECLTPEAADLARTGGLSPLRAAVGLQLPASCHLCPYWKQLQLAHDSAITLFNFSSFLFQVRIGRFDRRDLMVVDEAHNIEAQMMSFVSLELTEWALSIVGVRIERDIATKEQFVEWLRETDVVGKIQKRLRETEGDEDEENADLSTVEKEALEELGSKIENFLRFLDATDWILEIVEYEDRRGEAAKKILARPLYAKHFAEELLFRHADRILVMSATILDVGVWAENLGLDPADVAHVETGCEFPVKNRPIYKEYAGNMGRKYFSSKANPKDPTKPKFVAKVSTILQRHAGQRGIVHCHSFELSNCLRQDLGSSRFLFQDEFNDKTEMLKEHARRKDSVIVAPAMHEGFDLKDDLSRFQIIAKVPWPSMGDRVVKERMARDPRWFGWLTALKIVQSYGRSVRSKDDWAMTYILDTGFEGFAHANPGMLPEWFREALRRGAPTKEQVLR